MAILVRCFLDDVLLDDEPIGLSQIQLSVIRDQDLHGIGFEATTSALEFTGNGAQYLEYVRSHFGYKASTIFRVDLKCSPGEEFIEGFIKGKINYSNYKLKCGETCSVLTPVESVSCEMILKNRYDQGVDMDGTTTFDKVTGLVSYDEALNIVLTLPTKEIDYITEGYVLPGDEGVPVHNFTFAIRPNYTNIIAQNFNQSGLNGPGIIDVGGSGGLSPQILWDERLTNFPNPVIVNGRLKGILEYDAFTPVGDAEVRIFFAIGEYTSGSVVGTIVENHLLATFTDGVFYPAASFLFDITIAEYSWAPVDDGTNGVYLYLAAGLAECPSVTVVFYEETHFKAESTRSVPPSPANVYLVHETLSRVTESITDNCCRVKSSYYGRTDSMPFAFDADGCGGKRALTSGLKIRNAPNAKFFANLKDLIKGLQAIDNIGMGIEADETFPGRYVLRVEDLDFFYQPFEMLRLPLVSKAGGQVEAIKIYSTINIGYKKWETEANFGSDEYNANRIFRTSQTATQNKLDQTSGLIAGEYAWERTREQQFGAANDADTRYDNDNFILCLERLDYGYGYPYGGLIVEQNNITSDANIFSPGTTYNYRISPFRNLMRWARSILACYPNIVDSDARIYFSEGTGNLEATGRLRDALANPCTLEKTPIKESQDLAQTIFTNVDKVTPLWIPESVTFDYPLSLAEYLDVKDNPYGYISYQCGKGEFESGWLTELKYQPFQELATFTLRKGWPGKLTPIPTGVFVPPVIPPEPDPGLALKLIWDDIGNVPVGDPTSVSDWNTFFDTGANADTPFSSVTVVGNEVNLFGATNLIIFANLFASNVNIIYVIDYAECVIEIQGQAFDSCTNLIGVSFPACIETTFGGNFTLCTSLVQTNFPALVTLGNSTFILCSALTSISLPSCVTIEDDAFNQCTSLGSIDAPNVITVNNDAFFLCSNLADILSLQNVETIGVNSFAGCSNLTPPTFNNLTDIGDNSFELCTLMSSFSAPVLVNVGVAAFEFCSALTACYVPACTNLGGTTGDDGVFNGITGNSITLTIPTATQTDGDVVTLQANNTVTLILV